MKLRSLGSAGIPDSPKGSTRGVRFDKLFFSLVLFVAALNIPIFLNLVLPMHDTIKKFFYLYFFYNEFYFNGEIAHWLPFGYYGIQSDFYFAVLPPVLSLVGLVGNFLAISNIYALFKIAIFCEQLIYLYGVYKLSGRIFERKSTVAFVCLAAVGGTMILSQSSFNFRTYYLLPLIIYMIMRFFETWNLKYALGGMLAGAISFIGDAPYAGIILMLDVSVMFPFLFIGNFRTLKDIRMPGRRDIMLSVLLVAVIVSFGLSYHYFITHALDEVKVMSYGRDPKTGVVDIRTFLTYGGGIGWKKFLDLVIPHFRMHSLIHVNITAYDISLFFGLIPLSFFLYGLLFARKFKDPFYLALLAVVVVLSLLSMGRETPFAAFLYNRFPLMNLYRHIGYVVSCFKFLLPMLAGYGFEHFIAQAEARTKGKGGPGYRLGSYAIAVVLLLSAASIAYSFEANVISGTAAYYMAGIMIVVGLSLFLSRRLNPRTSIVAIVIVFYLIEAVSYQASLNIMFAKMEKQRKIIPVNEEIFNVNKYGFQHSRTQRFPNMRAVNALPLVAKATYYAFGYNFLQWDPCMAFNRADLLNENVHSLLTLWGDKIFFMSLRLPMRPLLLKSVACNSPKLRLLPEVILADSEAVAPDILRKSDKYMDTVVLSNFSEEDRMAWLGSSRNASEIGSINVTKYWANGIDMVVDVPKGGRWLYYADAWHSDWRATVNGKPAKIAKANVAFKAVLLPEGHNSVVFVFDPGLRHLASVGVVLIGILFMGFLLAAIVCVLMPVLPEMSSRIVHAARGRFLESGGGKENTPE